MFECLLRKTSNYMESLSKGENKRGRGKKKEAVCVVVVAVVVVWWEGGLIINALLTYVYIYIYIVLQIACTPILFNVFLFYF